MLSNDTSLLSQVFLPPPPEEVILVCSEGTQGLQELFDPRQAKLRITPKISQMLEDCFTNLHKMGPFHWSETVRWELADGSLGEPQLLLQVEVFVWWVESSQSPKIQLSLKLEWSAWGRPLLRHAHLTQDENSERLLGVMEHLQLFRMQVFELVA